MRLYHSRTIRSPLWIRHAAMTAGTLSLVACSLVDLSTLTNGSPGGDDTTEGDGSTGGEDPDATWSDDGSVVPNDDAGGNDGGTTDANDGDVTDANEDDAADGGANDAQTDAALEDATTGPTCDVTEFQSASIAENVYQKPDDNFFSSNEAWSSPKNAFTADAKFATADATASVSQLLLVRGFGFSLADTAVIQGVDVEVVRASNNTGVGPEGSIVEGSVRLRLESNKNSQSTRTLNGTWTSTVTTVAYGSATDTWDETLAGSIVNKPAFGVLFSFRANSVQFGVGARVDAIRVRLHYCQ